jgi:hypothetical protein
MLETLINISVVVVGVSLLAFFVKLVDEKDDENLGYRDDEEL